ncbi:venom allergen 5-like isoform X2 [Penaeus vannamei]
MAQRLCLLLTITAWAGGAAEQSPYCSFSPEHTLCRASGLGPTCGSQVPERGVSVKDAALILTLHNQLRTRVAMGKESQGAPGPQPHAANMRLMVWDDELATVAQGHADQCIFRHECIDCRRVKRFAVGQNLYLDKTFNESKVWKKAIQTWYGEVSDFSPADIDPYRFSMSTGHYTQMLWGSSYSVGCGFIRFKGGSSWKQLYTCNYGPIGNIKQQKMYQQGPPCSACPSEVPCSEEYPALCGVLKRLSAAVDYDYVDNSFNTIPLGRSSSISGTGLSLVLLFQLMALFL